MFNDGLSQVNSKLSPPGVNGLRAICYYVSAGFITNDNNNHSFTFYCGLRYGKEKSRFEFPLGNGDYIYYHYFNRTLSLIAAPGLKINTRQKLFLTLNLTRIYQSNEEGSGIRSTTNGNYVYEIGGNLLANSWDFRPGLKWQVKLLPQKKLLFELGIEPCLIQRKVQMTIKNPYNTLPPSVNYVNYNLVLVYAGFQF